MMNTSIPFALHLFVGSSITQSIFTVVPRVLYQRFGVLYTFFESLGPASFVPIQRLSRKFVAGYDKIGKKIKCTVCHAS